MNAIPHQAVAADTVTLENQTMGFDDSWRSALHWLDRLITQMLRIAAGDEQSTQKWSPFRGLAIAADEVVRILTRSSEAPMSEIDTSATLRRAVECLAAQPRVQWLCEMFGLSQVDLGVLLVALAPELDLRYERLYAFLQDDVTQKCPSIDLCASMVGSPTSARSEVLERFAGAAPLIRHGLLKLSNQTQNGLVRSNLAQGVQVDSQIGNFLLDRPGLDARLHDVCEITWRWHDLGSVPLRADSAMRLRELLDRGCDAIPVQIHLRCDDSAHARALALGIAGACELHCLELDWRTLTYARNAAGLLGLAFREAWLRRFALHIRHVDESPGEGLARCRDVLLSELASAPGLVILSGHESWDLAGAAASRVVDVDCRGLDEKGRRGCWENGLRRAKIAADAELIETLAARFELAPTQIERAVMSAVSPLRNRAAQDQAVVRDTIFTAARAQTRHRLANLALQIPLRHRWEEIVLPDDAVTQLREICYRVTGRSRVMNDWGFDDKLSLGKGTSVLFSGPSGTGKTMAAEIVAGEVGLDLFKIDLASVVSKYIGETEQNLEKIFAAAEGANAIMMFDEADALFGKRSEVRDSHDRYANLEISYLLQRIERYRGIAILTTNLRQNLDDAFLRRLAFVVNFPFPDVPDRERIWRRIWPRATPLAADVDLGYLARTFKLSGGNIKNVALAAAFLAANDGDVVTMAHLLRATRREYQKSGKTLGELPPCPRAQPTGALA